MAVVVSVTVALTPSPALAVADYLSFFFADPVLNGAGWSSCRAPVVWSVDTRGLEPRVSRREVRRLAEAWQAWSDVSGIDVEFGGRTRLTFDPATNNLVREDGEPQPYRHVYLAFKSPGQVPLMTENTVGVAMPSVVLLPTKEIIAGMAIFRRGYVVKARLVSEDRVLQLYLHEIGHILGLGHALLPANVMYPALDHVGILGWGDRKGVAAFTQPCPTD